MADDRIIWYFFFSWPVISAIVGLALRVADVIPSDRLWKRFFPFASLLALPCLIPLQPSSPDWGFHSLVILWLGLIPATASVTAGLWFPFKDGEDQYAESIHLRHLLGGIFGGYLTFLVWVVLFLMLFMASNPGGRI